MSDYIGQQFGNYRLIRLVGEGGFAQVYLGEHIYLNTLAAIKVLNAQMAGDPEVFRTEARTIARLVHPNIVRVLEFGVEGGTPFLVLDYAPNGTLRQYYSKGAIVPLPTVVSYVKQVAAALAYAHDEKVVHRDVKPENMLLGRNNEVLLSDFGIALMAQTVREQSAQNIAGTLAYMAPEQIQGYPRPASDQYSLGVIVYEWLAGERPFSGSVAELVSQQLAVPPRPLRAKVRIAPAVEQVVMKVLEKNPDRRFANIQAFALALEQTSQGVVPEQSNQPVMNSGPSPSLNGPQQPGGRVPLDATILPYPVSPPQASSGRAPIDPTIFPNAQVGERVPLDATILPYPVSPPQASGAGTSVPPAAFPSPALASQVRSGNIAGSPPPVPSMSIAQPKGTIVSSYEGHESEVRSISWFSGGTRIVSASGVKDVHVWDALTGKKFQVYKDSAEAVSIVAGSPDGTRIASVGSDAQVRVWDFSSNRLVTTYSGHTGSTINAMAWSPTQQLLATAASDGTVHVWDATTGQTLTIYRGHSGSVNTLAWSPTEFESFYHIVSGGDDATVQTWSTSTGRSIAIHRGQGARVVSVGWSPDVYPSSVQLSSFTAKGMPTSAPNSSRVGCGKADGMIQMWDTTTDREVLSYRYPTPISVVAWSPDGRRFAYASENNTVEVWDTASNRKLLTFTHAAPVRVMAWSPDGKHIASGGGDAKVQVWVAP